MKEDFERDDKNIISDMMIENMKTIITLWLTLRYIITHKHNFTSLNIYLYDRHIQ
jgi:hypothetical protein